MRQHPAEKVGRWNEVGIKDGDVLVRTLPRARSQGAGFIALAAFAAQMLNLKSATFQLGELAPNQLNCPVGRIVQYLNLELFARVVEGSHGINQSDRDIGFVVERELNSDRRQLRQRRRLRFQPARTPIAH